MRFRKNSLTCVQCGCLPRKPAISLALNVFCARCSLENGMFPGEHGTSRSYEEWKRLAAEGRPARHLRRAVEHA